MDKPFRKINMREIIKNGKIIRQVRYKEDKGRWIYRGNVLMDWDTKKFYWVLDPFKGILITITEHPKRVTMDQLEKEGCYLKRWIAMDVSYEGLKE